MGKEQRGRSQQVRGSMGVAVSRQGGAGCSRRGRSSPRSQFVQTSYGNWVRWTPPRPKLVEAAQEGVLAARQSNIERQKSKDRWRHRKHKRKGRCVVPDLKKIRMADQQQ